MEVKLDLKLQSTAFKDGSVIPEKYSCHSRNISPPLSWSPGSPSVKSWALIVDDSDAPMGVFTHWVIYNIPSSVNSLPESIPNAEKLPDGSLQGENSVKTVGWSGPCPPPGSKHHYHFKLYALDTLLNLPSGVSKETLEDFLHGHIIAQAKIVGLFQAP